jgi:chlorite dismutase
VLQQAPFDALALKGEYTMLGRTYSLGYEPDLEETLFTRPRQTLLNPEWKWAIWYPLRRAGAFMQLPAEQQREILMEHGKIGMAFGQADMAHDIRLACHGLDKNDSDFVIGLIGKELFPLSGIVQTMRKTTQTSLYLERLGPFFVGRKVGV